MMTNRRWHLITITVTSDIEELASAFLFDSGTTGIITLEENSDSVKFGAYFDARSDPEEIVRMIEAEFARGGLTSALLSISVSEVADQDWMQNWKEGFEPVEIGSRLIVAPSWKLPQKSAARAVVQIDPGMAFGTGTHETTRLCLEAIEQMWRGGSLLDVGTGTGILAIAAALLEPQSKVTAIDIDPQAVEVARENAEINAVAHIVEVFEAQPANLSGRAFDIVVANLTAEVIIALADDLAGCLAGEGLLILSGILSGLAPDVERAIIQARLGVVEKREAGEWAIMIARKRTA